MTDASLGTLIPAQWLRRSAVYLGLVGIGLILGAAMSGEPLSHYLAFPPPPPAPRTPHFSWPAFLFIAAAVVLCLAPFIARIVSSNRGTVRGRPPPHPFPAWGWLGATLTLASWLLAWNRFAWFAPLQEYTFIPLWLGYILCVNALTMRRTGGCLLIDHTRYFLALFPLSILFWWSFEFINRWIENWTYSGMTEVGGWHYFLVASLSFSTVLPAVLSTAGGLCSLPWLSAGLDHFVRVPLRPDSRQLPWFLIGAGTGGFVALAIWPEALFFLAWLAPLLLLAGLSAHAGERRLLCALADGDWHELWLLAAAGLVCGLFWELWNVKSLAHWEYAVPHVQAFEIFEMPLLGYAGYLPFGITCGLFADYVLPHRPWRDRCRPPRRPG